MNFWTRSRADKNEEIAWYLYAERARGVIAKGWMMANAQNPRYEMIWAVGGEDNMVQWGFSLGPIRFYAGFRVPRRLLRSWVYHRREWGIRYGYPTGHGVEILFGYDDDLDSMVDYYTRNGRPEWMGRLGLWPGWIVGGTKYQRLGRRRKRERLRETRRKQAAL